jgi:methionyl-tRNA synthetase
MSRRFYLTTPIYYVNGSPHIGHAYTSIAADVLARWKRLEGYEVFFLTGTDEHGQKVEKAAAAAQLDPQSFTDRVAGEFRRMAERLDVSFDDFIRTTEPRHKRATEALWQRLAERGEIYLGHYEGWYAVRDEAFYGEDELRLLPDGTRLAPTGAPVEWVREPSYFFRLSAWQERLLAFYEDNPDFIAPAARRNEVVSFVKAGLADLSISRTSFRWGIPVPGDPAHVIYVWIDALTNYISALGYPDETAPRWRFWPADLHLVGKEIVRFHAVYWPALLMAAGLPPPRRVFSHGWWTVEGEKMSKSLGNVIDPLHLAETYGVDALRYFLLREVPFGNDGDFSRKALLTRLNVELANDLGNLAQRSLGFIARFGGGRRPALGPLEGEARALLEPARALPGLLSPLFERLAFHEALEEIWRVVRAANSYIDRAAPWHLRKTDPPAMEHVLAVLLEVLRILATVLQPVMPGSMGRLLDQLGVPSSLRTLEALAHPLPAGEPLPPPSPIFPRLDGQTEKG